MKNADRNPIWSSCRRARWDVAYRRIEPLFSVLDIPFFHARIGAPRLRILGWVQDNGGNMRHKKTQFHKNSATLHSFLFYIRLSCL